MTVQTARDFLFWCSTIDLAILTLWFLVFMLAHDLLYRLHGLWFRISKERFDALHYLLMAIFKLAVLLFNVVPYLALRIAAS